MRTDTRDRLLARATAVLEGVTGTSRLLEAIAWPRSVERDFFASGATRLPSPEYRVDRDRASANVAALQSLEQELEGDHPMLRWLRDLAQSYADANRMLLAVGTHEFYRLSSSLYGGARTTALDADTTNLDFAEHLQARLGEGGDGQSESRALTSEEFADEIRERLARRRVKMALEIVLDEDLSAKAICGASRLRVRAGARFTAAEARSLYVHEVETHALTAQNGAGQPRLTFLRGGGPRSTRTQEGLAVFAELYDHALTAERLRRLVERVRLVHMAEQGASFLDLYRHLVGRGVQPQAAYLDAQRICRGGVVEGGAPFTKDACYLSGLMDVYNFLRGLVRAGARDVAEVLVSGRIALEDVDALVWLRTEGVLEPPRLLPRWLARYDSLLAYFSFTSFLNEVDLAPVEARARALFERTRRPPPASPEPSTLAVEVAAQAEGGDGTPNDVTDRQRGRASPTDGS